MTRPSLFTLQGVALALDRAHPAIGIHERGYRRPRGQGREGHTRRAIATSDGLIGPLDVVVVVVGLRYLPHLAQVRRSVLVQTLLDLRDLWNRSTNAFLSGRLGGQMST
jgi:hypothetical protein